MGEHDNYTAYIWDAEMNYMRELPEPVSEKDPTVDIINSIKTEIDLTKDYIISLFDSSPFMTKEYCKSNIKDRLEKLKEKFLQDFYRGYPDVYKYDRSEKEQLSDTIFNINGEAFNAWDISYNFAKGLEKEMMNNKDWFENFSLIYYNKIQFVPIIKKVIISGPATIVKWSDGTKTIVKCQPGDSPDPEKGLAMAITRKALGRDYKNFDKYLNDALDDFLEKEYMPKEQERINNMMTECIIKHANKDN